MALWMLTTRVNRLLSLGSWTLHWAIPPFLYKSLGYYSCPRQLSFSPQKRGVGGTEKGKSKPTGLSDRGSCHCGTAETSPRLLFFTPALTSSTDCAHYILEQMCPRLRMETPGQRQTGGAWRQLLRGGYKQLRPNMEMMESPWPGAGRRGGLSSWPVQAFPPRHQPLAAALVTVPVTDTRSLTCLLSSSAAHTTEMGSTEK